jgi:hypothetical protein
MSTSNFLGGLFGQMPSYIGGLLSPEEQDKLKQEAQNQGVLNLGLSLLAGSGRSPVRRTTGELVAQGLQAGQQAYRGATQQAIQDKMLGLQFAEIARKQQAEKDLPGVLQRSFVSPTITRPATTQEREDIYAGDIMAEPPTTVQDIGAPRFDVQRFLQEAQARNVPLAMAMPFAQQYQSFTAPKTVTLKPGEKVFDQTTGKELFAIPKDTEWSYQNTPQGLIAISKDDPNKKFQVTGPDPQRLSGDIGNLALMHFKTNDPSKLPEGAAQQLLNAATTLAKARSAKVEVNTSDPTAVAKAVAEQRKGWLTESKDDREVAGRFGAMTSAYQGTANPASDATMIYSLAKILDPTGAVREGDIETIKGKRNIPETLVALAQKVSRGGFLTPTERENLMTEGYSIMAARQRNLVAPLSVNREIVRTFGGRDDQIDDPYQSVQKPAVLYPTIGGKRQRVDLAQNGSYYFKSIINGEERYFEWRP